MTKDRLVKPFSFLTTYSLVSLIRSLFITLLYPACCDSLVHYFELPSIVLAFSHLSGEGC